MLSVRIGAVFTVVPIRSEPPEAACVAQVRAGCYAVGPMNVSERIARVESLLAGHTDRRDEATILDLLADPPDPELDATLAGLDLARLLDDVDDRILGPDNRARLVELLARQRIGALSLPVRAALVHALARGRTDRRQEQGICDVLLATRGDELRQLKRTIDTAGDHRHLLHIVYSDVDDPEIRGAILRHVRREADPLAHSGLVVLSDIDDTIYANFGDARVAKKTLYPGVLELYASISSEAPVFVTARPADRPGVVEALTHASLQKRGIWPATVLAGDLLHIHSNAAIASRKLSNFQAYADLFGEYDFVFVGDSSQGDASFGAAMLEQDPDRVRAVLIHDVAQTPAAQREDWARRGVSFFDNYVGAARIACERGLVDADAWRRVADVAREGFVTIVFEDPAARERMRADLDRELARVPRS